MKNILLVISVVWLTTTFVQTNINTENPQSTLDINEDLRVIKESDVGRFLIEKVNSGKGREVLISTGKDKVSNWVSLK